MIVACVQRKGGAGKTTVALSLACELSQRGRSVVVADADPQGSAQAWAAQAAELGNAAATVVGIGPGFHRPAQLPRLSEGYDVTIVDCPPHNGEIMRSALAVADVALLPCGPSPLDVWALGDSVALVEQARQIRPALIAAVVLNRTDRRTALGARARELLADCGLPVLSCGLAMRVGYAESLAAGQGPSTYRPRSTAAREVRELANEVLELVEGTARAA